MMNRCRRWVDAASGRLPLVLLGVVSSLFLATVWLPSSAWAQTGSGTIVDDAASLEPGEVVRIEDGELRQIAFSPDESTLAVATSAGLWIYAPNETSNGELLTEEPVQALWWSADGTKLAITLDDGSLQLWQMADKELLGAVDATAGAILSVAWSPDANQIATGSADGVIEIWSVGEGVVLETLEGHTGAISDLYWIADGSQIVSAAADGSVRVWGVEVAAPATPTSVPTPTPRQVLATVQVDRLNVRSGPGTDFQRVGTGLRGEQLIVLDQEDSCAWVEVRTPGGIEGWVAGTTQFVTLDSPCEVIGQ
ncbi:MAG TPA: SH3 domain-containing protein, partial [Caldilineaceae bacterium]|nr:SH3 domain-containing protein [Caldilineaceae bacterium]